MAYTTRSRRLTLLLTLLIGLGFSNQSWSEAVLIRTTLGNFTVILFDQQLPITVENFIEYVEQGHYNNSIIHRLEKDFILQGGALQLDQNDALTSITTSPPIINQAMFSNIRGTIAMAKLNDDPDSATSQWFINLQDNSEVLDFQNGGFTVFGIVFDPGMEIVDALAQAQVFNFDPLPQLPLLNYSYQDAENGEKFTSDNFLKIEEIIVIGEDIKAEVPLPPTISATPPPADPPPQNDNDDEPTIEGVGSIDLVTIGLIVLLALARYCRIRRDNTISA